MAEQQNTSIKSGISRFQPVIMACLLHVLGLIVTFLYIRPGKVYIEENQIAMPQVDPLPIILYFIGVVVVIGLVLYFIPMSKLKYVLRVLFGVFYAWGIFVITGIFLPGPAAVGLGAALGILWLFLPLVWLQNLLLLLTLVGVGGVFGSMISPWAMVIIMGVISVYDIVAVFSGYMMWMAKKLSMTESLPAFIFPFNLKDFNLNLRGSAFTKIFESESSERDFSLLGGGDIGFPLIFVTAVFFHYSLEEALIVAAFSLAGLILAYVLQMYLLKGKPLPALPPISLMTIIGFLLVFFF